MYTFSRDETKLGKTAIFVNTKSSRVAAHIRIAGFTEKTIPAGDGRFHHNSIIDRNISDSGTDLNDFPNIFMTENNAFLGRMPRRDIQYLYIGTANTRHFHLNQHIVGSFNHWKRQLGNIESTGIFKNDPKHFFFHKSSSGI